MLRWRSPPLRVCLLRYHRRANNARLLLRWYYHTIVNVNERRYYADANCGTIVTMFGTDAGVNQHERDISASQRGWSSRFISLINKRAVLKLICDGRFRGLLSRIKYYKSVSPGERYITIVKLSINPISNT